MPTSEDSQKETNKSKNNEDLVEDILKGTPAARRKARLKKLKKKSDGSDEVDSYIYPMS